MLPVLTLTLNPALDISVETPHVIAGPKLRCTSPARHPGGGGVNVSRVIRRLGGQTLALLALGGRPGNGWRIYSGRKGLRRHDFPPRARRART
ncbi:MAG: hypothetical protein R3D87_03110 [Paracoccaceae bacterium]